MAVIAVPYFLDEYLPDLDLVLRPDVTVAVPLPDGDAWVRLSALNAALADAVCRSLDQGCPVVVCGDCCDALGVVAGLQAAGRSVGIVWFDAHGDLHTPETSTSGFLGGMPLRLLCGYRSELVAAGLGLAPVAEEHVVLVGARDLDPPEVSFLAGSAICRREVASLVAADLPDMPLYVHIDLDVLDPEEVPGLRYPAPGGPDGAQLAGALRMLLATGRVAALTIACTWYPGHNAAARISPEITDAVAPAATRTFRRLP